MLGMPAAMRILTTWCITLIALCHPVPRALGVTLQLPAQQDETQPVAKQAAPHAAPSAIDGNPAGDSPLSPDQDPAFGPPFVANPPPALEDDTDPAPAPAQFVPVVLDADTGVAVPTTPPPTGSPVHIEADRQTKHDDTFTLTGNIVILYQDYAVRADRAVYNSATGDLDATGHLQVDGGPSDEHLRADHGVMNLNKHTGHFWNVRGTLGLRKAFGGQKAAKYVFTAPNPFALSGKELLQFGPGHYRIVEGAVTSCRLPEPDWQLLADSILVQDDVAHARGTTFDLFGLPFFWLPYMTHPVALDRRQTGVLLPIFGNDTQKGAIAGDSVYVVLGRSADATIGSEYYSRRGFSPFGQVRYRGQSMNFAQVRWNALLDRLPGAENQGGADIVVNGRRDFDPQTRAISSVEYLSSYVYRQAFEENYSAAINSEVKSNLFLTREHNGLAATGLVARYQNFRSDTVGDEIKVLHVPQLQLDALDQPVGKLPVLWGGQASATGLSRSEPGFQTSAVVPRVDFYPHIAIPLHGEGWNLRAEAGVRDTFYGKSQQPGSPGDVPAAQLNTTLNRAAFTGEVELHPPTLERDFTVGHTQLRHTIEPEFRYNYVAGIDHYANTLRFDMVDAMTDTNQVEYGLTQHLFLRHTRPHTCKGDEALGPDDTCGGGTVDWLTWTVAQQHYFNPTFGGAVVNGQRNVFASTLDFTGVAFTNEVRPNSPVISRLRLQTTSVTDLEWDVDYDLDEGRMQSSNLFASYRAGNYYFSVGDARLVNLQPQVSSLPSAPTPNPNSTSLLDTFNQIHMAAVYGTPTKHGVSAGANMGYDLVLNQLQYLGVQTSYNRDCCGFAVEMRRYSLGIVRDDTQYLFSFTLAGVGSAGSLRPMLRVF